MKLVCQSKTSSSSCFFRSFSSPSPAPLPALYPTYSLFPRLRWTLNEWMDRACQRAGLQIIRGQRCKECKSPPRRGGRGEERRRNKRERQGCQRQGMGRRPSYGAWRAEVWVPRSLPRLAPQNVPFFASRPVNHCHLNSMLSLHPSSLLLPGPQTGPRPLPQFPRLPLLQRTFPSSRATS